VISFIAAPEGEKFPGDTLDEPLAVRVTDDEGNPSAGRTVLWTASGDGALIPASMTTDSAGVVRATWILDVKPGTQSASVAVQGSDPSATIQVETAGWRVQAVSASRGNHACAIDLAGDTYCWLGSPGSIPDRIETPVRFRTLVTGQRHTCGLGNDNRVYCWGSNDAGQLGDGTTTDRALPTAVHLPPGDYRSVAAGEATTCAVTLMDEAWCWGANDLGVLGRGFASEYEATPAPVSGDVPWRSISTSGMATCGIDPDGQVFCWGEDDNGGPPVLTPQAVGGIIAEKVALSDWAKCAVSSGEVYCWGSGTGAAVPVAMHVRVRSISAGYKPIFGLGMDGLGYYWGSVPNSSYGWGDPPTPFEGGMRFLAVGGNDISPFAVELETSTLYTWNVVLGETGGAVAPIPVPRPAD